AGGRGLHVRSWHERHVVAVAGEHGCHGHFLRDCRHNRPSAPCAFWRHAMTGRVIALLFGAGIGVVFAWAGLSDPAVIRDMLLLREPDVFLLMGSAIVVAAAGTHILRQRGIRALATGETVAWSVERPRRRQ